MGQEDKHRFMDALSRYVRQLLNEAGGEGEYLNGVVRVLDARGALFQHLPGEDEDEEKDCYALRRLIRVGEDLETEVNTGRVERIAAYYFD